MVLQISIAARPKKVAIVPYICSQEGCVMPHASGAPDDEILPQLGAESKVDDSMTLNQKLAERDRAHLSILESELKRLAQRIDALGNLEKSAEPDVKKLLDAMSKLMFTLILVAKFMQIMANYFEVDPEFAKGLNR